MTHEAGCDPKVEFGPSACLCELYQSQKLYCIYVAVH
jgi:hypothetical protein